MEYNKSSLLNSNNECYTYQGGESMIKISDEEEDLLNNINGLRKGQWTPEEDSKLASAISTYGVVRWNALAYLAGLRRSGKSCRLRWLNYLRPDLRLGAFTLQEQLLILQLHFRWGNRWSKIAEHLPGRTDNEIKNYWRTKVQKLARQFHCQVNSPQFRYALQNTWIPRLIEQIQADATATSNPTKAQFEGPSCVRSNGLLGGSSSGSSTSSRNCDLIDTPLSWPQYSLDQHIIGPDKVCSKPNVSTDSCEAQVSTESGSSDVLDQNWELISEFLREMTLYDEDNILFWETLNN